MIIGGKKVGIRYFDDKSLEWNFLMIMSDENRIEIANQVELCKVKNFQIIYIIYHYSVWVCN